MPRHPPYALFNLTVNSSKIIVKTLSENFFSGFSVLKPYSESSIRLKASCNQIPKS